MSPCALYSSYANIIVSLYSHLSALDGNQKVLIYHGASRGYSIELTYGYSHLTEKIHEGRNNACIKEVYKQASY